MCRHAAYLGPPIALETFLLAPSHGLVEQSYRPREMLTAKLNADGFGFGWYLDDGEARRYANPMPIWSDVNVVQLGPALRSRLWIGNVRSATRGQPIGAANTPPYRVKGLLFSHNGFIRDFARTARPVLRGFLAPEVEAEINGNTDSEYLFAVLRQLLAEVEGNVEIALARLLARLDEWLGDTPGLFNFLVADGAHVYATRHAVGHESPSLYLGRDDRLFPGGWLVASEPLTDSSGWEPAPDHHLFVLSADRPPRKVAL